MMSYAISQVSGYLFTDDDVAVFGFLLGFDTGGAGAASDGRRRRRRGLDRRLH